MKVSGNIVDVLHKKIFPGTLEILNGRIIKISENKRFYDRFIIPGFVDSHVHIESSMLIPSEFSRIAVIHGTVATVSDPHEISNVLGIQGIRYMIRNGKQVPFKFSFGAPSCVPASPFETSGDSIGPDEVNSLLAQEEIGFLGEVMNVSGVLANNPDVLRKIESAVRFGKPIDGHAPGLQGNNLVKYVSAGISTDHETLSYEEGREKLSLGMKLLIREGSAARSMDILLPLINEYPNLCMFCSDDKHPNDLIAGHINVMVKKAIQNGIDVFTTLQCACINPVTHYRLPVGLLREGDPADFLIVDNLKDFTIHETYINGGLVAQEG
jgi:adenine deaminase